MLKGNNKYINTVYPVTIHSIILLGSFLTCKVGNKNPTVNKSVRLYFYIENLRDRSASLDQILSEPSLGWGKAALRFQADWIKLWFPW